MIKLLNAFQNPNYELRKREFNRLKKIQQFYQLTSCLLKMQRKNKVTIFFFTQTKKQVFFSKTTTNQRAKLIFSKNWQKYSIWWWTFSTSFINLKWKSVTKEARRLKSKIEDRIQKTDGEDEETVLDFLAQYEVYGYLEKWWGIW